MEHLRNLGILNLPVKMLKLNDQDFLGEATCYFLQIVRIKSQSLTLDLFNKTVQKGLKKLGSLTVHAEVIVSLRSAVDIKFRCSNLENKDTLPKSDPFLRISKIIETGGSIPICKIEVINNNLNPTWKPLCLTMQQFGSKAIMEVGEVIQFYDSEKHFPVWGFGGRISNGSISHCFNLNGTKLEVEGVDGIMNAYTTALHNVCLEGPTLFGLVVNTAAEIAGQSLSHNENKYFVLLIITDGVLTDTQKTIDALVRASDLPLSILIVGVGNADFKQMEIQMLIMAIK